MSKEMKSELERLVSEKRSLPDCERRRNLEKKINELGSKLKNESDLQPEVLVKYAGKVIGKLKFNTQESSWMYHCNDGSASEVAFSYDEARSWASMAGYHLKVVRS